MLMKRNISKKYLDGRGKYVGELATLIYEPIILGPQPPLAEYETSNAAWKRGMERAISKIPRLMRWHGVDPSSEGALSELAFRLALTHVPGMRIEHTPRRGRRPTWKIGLGVELVREVDGLRKERNVTIKLAIKELKKINPEKWKGSEQNLIVRHREARRALRKNPFNQGLSPSLLKTILGRMP
jgi:hypothetical protein